MGHALRVGSVVVDARDVAAWSGRPWDGTAGGDWVALAERYVAEHPRPARGLAEAQRLAILRRLAAGPATRSALLAAMRSTGFVAAADFENRLRDLKAGDTRAGGRTGVPLDGDGTRWWLAEPFPALDDADRQALGFALSMIEQLDGPLAQRAGVALNRLVPGLGDAGAHHAHARYAATPADFERFHVALEDRAPVKVRYFSLNSGRERTYNLVPLEYVTLGATVKAVCVEVDATGSVVTERQFAMDRVRAVEELPGWPRLARDLAPRRADLLVEVTEELYQVMRDRNLFGVRETSAQELEAGVWRVAGSFPVALAWDVMEQLCAWAGNAQVWQPHWLVNAVVRRLSAGLRVMQEGAPFDLVKPEVQRSFADHGEAVAAENALPGRQGPRKLTPPSAPTG